MADIFLSYSSSDRETARRVANSLATAGLSVWWDDRLSPVEQWDRLIEREIRDAGAVLVLWTPRAVESDWVRVEANYARQKKKLLQARFEDCEVPLQFTLFQWADLDEWLAGISEEKWQKLLDWFRCVQEAKNPQCIPPSQLSPASVAKIPTASEFAETLVDLARKAAASGSGMYEDVAIPSLQSTWPEFVVDYRLNYGAIERGLTHMPIERTKVFEAGVHLTLYFLKVKDESESYRALSLAMGALKAANATELGEFLPLMRNFARFAIQNLEPADMALYAFGRMLGATANYIARHAPDSVKSGWLATTTMVLSTYGRNSKLLVAGFREFCGDTGYLVEILEFGSPEVGAILISVLLKSEEDSTFTQSAVKRFEALRDSQPPLRQ